MAANRSIEFFERQFERQIEAGDFALNPFERAALPHLRGRVLDLGCGMGNLSVAAAARGCTVVALDASATAIARLRGVAASAGLDIEARQAELMRHSIEGIFDSIVSIGLLMFFDGPSASRALVDIQAHVRAGGTAIVNVLVEGTTYTDMFDPGAHCLFARGALADRFAHWEILRAESSRFDAPGGRLKAFETVVARKPGTAARAP